MVERLRFDGLSACLCRKLLVLQYGFESSQEAFHDNTIVPHLITHDDDPCIDSLALRARNSHRGVQSNL